MITYIFPIGSVNIIYPGKHWNVPRGDKYFTESVYILFGSGAPGSLVNTPSSKK